jgi:hypothetical protein
MQVSCWEEQQRKHSTQGYNAKNETGHTAEEAPPNAHRAARVAKPIHFRSEFYSVEVGSPYFAFH